MSVSTIGAVGQGLQPPQAPFPNSILGDIPGIIGTNRVTLPPGGDILIPSGTYLVSPGVYSQVQILDPVSNTWLPYCSLQSNGPFTINSDGVNYRVINPTGFPTGAVVTNVGSGYTSAPTVTANIGGSVWQAVLGPGVSAISAASAINANGVSYSVPPIVSISAPASPGIQATAIANISGGAVSSYTITNPGAGYSSPPSVYLTPQPSDQNFSASSVRTVNAQAVAVTSFVGQVLGVLLVNEGNNSLSVAPALSITGGGGSGALATAVMAFAVQNYTISAAGSAYSGTFAPVISFGGSLASTTSGTSASAASPIMGANLFVPRQIQAIAAVSGGVISIVATQNSGIADGGLFQTPPFLTIGEGGPGSSATLTANVGGVNDTVYLQQL